MNQARVVWLMAGVAELAAGMLLGVDLREALRLGDVFGVAADAEMGDVGFLRLHARGVVGVLGERAVAGLTVDVDVRAFRFGIGDVGMAGFAGVMAGINDGTCGDFGDGVAAKMAIAAKAFGNEGTTEDKEKNHADSEDGGHAKEMVDVLQFEHEVPATPQNGSHVRSYNAGEHRTTGHRSHSSVIQVTTRIVLVGAFFSRGRAGG